MTGEWVEIPNAESLTDVQLEAASDAVDAMTFVRTEDGAFNPNNPNEFFFVTTGSSSGADDGVNELGPALLAAAAPRKPAQGGDPDIVYNADTVVAAGGDIAISPDNLDASSRYLMINEDGTTESRAVMAAKGRDGSIWRFDLVGGPVTPSASTSPTATRVAQLDPPGRTACRSARMSGRRAASSTPPPCSDADTWISDVQAHPPTTAPGGRP